MSQLPKINLISVTEVYKAVTSDIKKINMLRGGTRSSKSYSLLQMVVKWLWTGDIGNKHIPKGEFFVLRETFPALRRTLLREYINMLHAYGIYPHIRHIKSHHEFIYQGRRVSFFSLDDQSKVLGSQNTMFWINEANAVNFDIFMQLLMRNEEFCFLDYNPYDPDTWLKEELEDRRLAEEGDVSLNISTYKMNPYLPESMVKEIERLWKTDKELAEVYTFGKWTKLTGVIFPYWKEVNQLPEKYDKEYYGIDFGWRDPTAAVQVRKVGNDLYIKEIIYKRDMLIDAIAVKLPRGKKIYCDAADPRSIEELRRRGILVRPAKKGPDSIMQGINRIRQFNLFITSDSINIISEFRKYKWQKGPDGKEISKPIDMYNHCADALRYSLSYSMRSKLQLM